MAWYIFYGYECKCELYMLIHPRNKQNLLLLDETYSKWPLYSKTILFKYSIIYRIDNIIAADLSS